MSQHVLSMILIGFLLIIFNFNSFSISNRVRGDGRVSHTEGKATLEKNSGKHMYANRERETLSLQSPPLHLLQITQLKEQRPQRSTLVYTPIDEPVIQTAPGQGEIFTEPRDGRLVTNRLDFRVSGSISEDLYQGTKNDHMHYWVSLAIVTNGQATLHFPKFYVKEPRFSQNISDGGSNPYPDAQMVQLLLLRVDDEQNRTFIDWLHRGKPYHGLEVNSREITAHQTFYFP